MMFCTGPSWSCSLNLCWWVESCFYVLQSHLRHPMLGYGQMKFTLFYSLCVNVRVCECACVCVCVRAGAVMWFGNEAGNRAQHSALCQSVCVCEQSVIPLDYLHAFHSAPLSFNPWVPGSSGLNLSSQNYYTSQGGPPLRRSKLFSFGSSLTKKKKKGKEKSVKL